MTDTITQVSVAVYQFGEDQWLTGPAVDEPHAVLRLCALPDGNGHNV